MKRTFSYLAPVLIFGLIAGACSDDDGDDSSAAGSGGRGGASAAGSAGASGSATAGAAGSAGAAGAAGSGPTASAEPMTFFVSSTGGDEGGNFGGLDGADAFCDELATAAGAGDGTWRAFLSTDDVDARTRIGDGPWHNADGVLIAQSLTALLTDAIPLDVDNAMNPDADSKRLLLLDETGAPVSSDPLQHDILTGSDQAGNRVAGQNCAGWTSSAADVNGLVGHSDSRGPQGTNTALGWLSTHASQGCSAENLVATGGSGRIYCFAAD